MSSISVANHKKKHHPAGWCFFLPRSIGASRLAPQGVDAAELGSHSLEWANPRRKARILVRAKGAAKANGVAELGSHFASKAMGARSREPRAKIFAQRANTLVLAKRCGIRFAFEPKAVGELAHQRLGEESSPKASTPVRSAITNGFNAKQN